MDKSSDPVTVRNDASASGDMEQVRQLILGDHEERQAQQIEALDRRVAHLEGLLRAIVSHGEATRRTWQDEVAGKLDMPTRNGGGR